MKHHRNAVSKRGSDYLNVKAGPFLGQDPPGLQPEVFAPGVISTGLAERDVAISPDGRYFLFMSSRFFPKREPKSFVELQELHTQHNNGNADIGGWMPNLFNSSNQLDFSCFMFYCVNP